MSPRSMGRWSRPIWSASCAITMQKSCSSKETVQRIAQFLNARWGEGAVKVTLTDWYRNMAEALSEHMHIVETAKQAVRELGAQPVSDPIRGGTDGARLTYMGLICPNLGTGSHNHHGKMEYACVQAMDKCV